MKTSKSKWIDLYILRHGIAQERSLEIDDEIRSLTNKGRIKAIKVVKRLKALGFEADRIFTSPYARAHETAKIALKEGLGKNLRITKSLEPLGDPFLIFERLSNKNLFVGHEPTLGNLITTLIQSQPNAIYLKKTGFAHLRWNKNTINPIGSTELICLIKPSLLK